MKPTGIPTAQLINKTCACKTLNEKLLIAQLEKEELLHGLYQEIVNTRPHLFSSTMVFISPEELTSMRETIEVIERTIVSEKFQQLALVAAPAVAQKNFGPHGVFMGYDFHLSDKGPKLIEINTNAGGAYLNAALAQAQNACCQDVIFDQKIEDVFYQMFLSEWHTQRDGQELKTIAIVDENPKEQYLYPEFRLFQGLFRSRGIQCLIADPREFKFQEQGLYLDQTRIDLVYNRLTDFYLDAEPFIEMKNAYLAGSVVLTPNPHHHALYANKLNLEVLSIPEKMQQLHLSADDEKLLLKGIPRTEILNPLQADDFWERRKGLFFKPSRGYGSKASYRGDKLTKRVWEEILQEAYVAQEIIPPCSRLVDVGGKNEDLKLDIRAYVYRGQIQLLAARLYSGQTTNFRTFGGGFAPVFVTLESPRISVP
jgi:hypothetical protein